MINMQDILNSALVELWWSRLLTTVTSGPCLETKNDIVSDDSQGENSHAKWKFIELVQPNSFIDWNLCIKTGCDWAHVRINNNFLTIFLLSYIISLPVEKNNIWIIVFWRFHSNAGVRYFCAMDTQTSKRQKLYRNHQSKWMNEKWYVCAEFCTQQPNETDKIWKFMDFNRKANSHFTAAWNFSLLCDFTWTRWTEHCTLYPSQFIYAVLDLLLHRLERVFRFHSTSKSLNIIIIRNKIILNSKSSIVIKLSISAASSSRLYWLTLKCKYHKRNSDGNGMGKEKRR